MYITYETNQYYIDEKSFTIKQHTEPPKLIPSTIPKPDGDSMPTKLVRVSDMKVVAGQSINEGYCALSYSWSWCGENDVKDDATGKAIRVDKGKHKIVFPDEVVQQVKFEGIIQQLCKDFNVRYIWFDQMCIDQGDKEEKSREMKRMHTIYSNAYCTIALVPELQTEIWSHGGESHRGMGSVSLMHSDWMKRIWTLEEGMMSSNLLFVGKDTYMWWYTAVQWTALGDLVNKPSVWNVSTILYYAHARKSTKEHDRVFAIANLFPELMDQITISYDQPILEFLISFYGILARHDLSILYFGKDQDYERIVERYDHDISLSPNMQQRRNGDTHFIPIRKYDLPSWTGVKGEHDLFHKTGGVWKTSFKNYSVDDRLMKICCSYLPSMDHICNNPFVPLLRDDLPPLPNTLLFDNNVDKGKDATISFTLAIEIRLPGSTDPKIITIAVFDFTNTGELSPKEDSVHTASVILERLSIFMPINKKRLFWCKEETQLFRQARMDFSLTEEVDYSVQYAILTEIAFENSLSKTGKHQAYPVVRTDGDYYKAIGVCLVTDSEYLYDGYDKETVQKTFIIN